MIQVESVDLETAPARPAPLANRLIAALAGAVLVAVAAQAAAMLRGTPVPITLQPVAALIVGGLLGPRFGAAAMVMYLVMGAAGLPVFAPSATLPPGVTRLFGPTGGYLLAYPVAAALAGLIVARWRGTLPACVLGPLGGCAVILTGGWAQLSVMTGDPAGAYATGVAPFLLKDVVSAVVAGLVIRRFLPTTRALQ